MEVTVFSTSAVILVAIGLFLAVAVFIGLFYKKRIDATEDFAAAGRSLTWPFVMASVVATWIGAAVILGGATEVYEYGYLRQAPPEDKVRHRG
jgi:Na+/proline symporter